MSKKVKRAIVKYGLASILLASFVVLLGLIGGYDADNYTTLEFLIYSGGDLVVMLISGYFVSLIDWR